MKVTTLESFPEGTNAFNSDFENMGMRLGMRDNNNRILAMMRNHPEENMNWVVIVNEETGERIRIDFDK